MGREGDQCRVEHEDFAVLFREGRGTGAGGTCFSIFCPDVGQVHWKRNRRRPVDFSHGVIVSLVEPSCSRMIKLLIVFSLRMRILHHFDFFYQAWASEIRRLKMSQEQVQV